MTKKTKMDKLGNIASGFINLAIASQALEQIKPEYFKTKQKRFNKLKGGNNEMETKSRYEVIAELEEKKRSLILERDSLDSKLKAKERELKELKREVEDKEEEIQEFRDSMEESKQTTSELIKSIDESLNRFADLGTGKKS